MSKKVCSRKTVSSLYSQSAETKLNGHGILRVGQLPDHIIADLDTINFNIPSLLKTLDLVYLNKESFFSVCSENLRLVLGRLINFETRRNSEDSTSESEHNHYAETFYRFGGVEVLVRILMHESLFPPEFTHKEETQEKLIVKSLILEVITKMITTKIGPNICDYLLANDDFLNYAFTLLYQKATHINACQVLEDLLQTKPDVFDLNRIRNLKDIILKISESEAHLSNFCRILAVTISDLDIYDNKSLYAQNQQKRSSGFVNIRDLNQEFLLNIPELLPRLVNVATNSHDLPRYYKRSTELECWMQWIQLQMDDEMQNEGEPPNINEYVGGIYEPATAGGDMIHQQGLYITQLLVDQVEVIYVLGLFLVGKHRKKVQRKLAELNLIPGLCTLFNLFIWKIDAESYSRHRSRGHSAACECSPEVALKIQFLRLVHSFCDHSDYKHLLLSKEEFRNLKQINDTLVPDNEKVQFDNVNEQLMCHGSQGLLTKIIEVMKKEPTSSTFRFWLARAVESYLRGNISYCDQILLLKRGLLNHVALNIIDNDIRHKEILQSSFDLLGELIKFNTCAFNIFNTVLDTKIKFDKFVNIINKNLVDSNMFIRSLILSVEHFKRNLSTTDSEFISNSKLIGYISDFKTQLRYLYRLIKLINVQNLTQENVSCLNTTLVFLMFANEKSCLPEYLKALGPLQEDKHSTECVMSNFRELLIFWQDHYLHKDKDCSALEKSSRISFDYWKETVAILVSEDQSSPKAILSYIPVCAPNYSNRTN